MRTALWIAAREIRERRAVLAAALVAGLLPFASPLVPGVAADRIGEARDAMAALLAVGFGAILSLLLGAGAISRDLAENRLGFDFVRPIGGLSIWSGRLGSAVVLTLAAMAVVAAPATLVGGRLFLPGGVETTWRQWPVIVAIVLMLIGLAHCAAVAFRSRSRWLALDLVGIVVVLMLAASGVRRVHDAFAVQTAFVLAFAGIVLTIPALWIASAVQVARGRTDLVLGHRAQSVVLWSQLLVIALCLWGYSLWFVAADVGDLVNAYAAPAPRGSWIKLDGSARGRPGLEAQFLLDTESGRSRRLAPGDLRIGNATLYSSDARRAVWVHRTSTADATAEVFLIDLDSPTLATRETSISFDLRMPFRTDVAPSGERLVTLQGQSLAVHDLDNGRILAAVKFDGGESEWGRALLAFVDETRARVYGLGDLLVAHELDVDTRTTTTWTGPNLGSGYPQLAWRPDHDRLILSNPDAIGILLLDGATGATIAELAPPGAEPKPHAAFLADGRIVRIGADGTGRARLDLLTGDGEPLTSFDLGVVAPNESLLLGAEAAPGTLLAARGVLSKAPPQLFVVDLASGRTRNIEGRGLPTAAMTWIAQTLPAEPGSVGSRLVQRGGSVWLVDVAAGTLRHVAGREG